MDNFSIGQLIRHIAAIIAPQWPVGFSVWYHEAALLATAITKLYRGHTMRRFARRIDFFGWSIIGFDLIFGTALTLAVIWVFYPGLHEKWFDYITTTAVLIVALTQTYTIKRAPKHRVDRAISSDPPRRADGTPINAERRQGYRRQSDIERDREVRDLRREIRRYREQHPAT